MEQNMTIAKINQLGKAGDVICKIAKVCLLIGIIGSLIGTLILWIVPKEAARVELTTTNRATVYLDGDVDLSRLIDLDGASGILELGRNKYQLVTNEDDEPTEVTTTVYLSNMKWITLGAAVSCALVYVAFRFAGKLCVQFKTCQTPFTEDIAKGLTDLAWGLIPLCVVEPLMESLMDSFTTGQVDVIVSIDLMTVLLILFVFMLSHVFKHGAALQTQSDETL